MSKIKEVVIPIEKFEYMQKITTLVSKKIGELRPESTIPINKAGCYGYPEDYTGNEKVDWKKVSEAWSGIIVLLNNLKIIELVAKGIDVDDCDDSDCYWDIDLGNNGNEK